MLNWQKAPQPLFSPVPHTWMEDQTANPDVLRLGDQFFLYFRGQLDGHDRIGVATIPVDQFDGKTWHIRPEPVIDVGAVGDWDETHLLDPAAIEVNGTIFLYYSAVCPGCNRSVCLATSQDGIHFEKTAHNPIIIGGAPEIVFYKNLFHLFYWLPGAQNIGFDVHLATSRDGVHFKPIQNEPVLPVGSPGEWDSHTVETPRIFCEDDVFYMMYCGSSCNDDYPEAAGLAVSRDLVHWQKYAHNPIFQRGNPGTWDEGAIWFTTVEKINGIYYLWYEGYGGGTARKEVYGSYLQGGKSQVGFATLKADYFFIKPADVPLSK